MSSETTTDDRETASPVEQLVIRDGCPPLRVWDIVLVPFAGDRREFVVIPQGEGSGIAVRMLLNGSMAAPWILVKAHFAEAWVVTGRFVPTDRPAKHWRWWHTFCV
jgi:hypothetical protein